MPSGNKPLPEPMLTQICRYMVLLGHNELNQQIGMNCVSNRYELCARDFAFYILCI